MSTFIQGARVTLGGEGKRLNVLGDNQRVVLTGEDTGGRYALIENFNPPGMEEVMAISARYGIELLSTPERSAI